MTLRIIVRRGKTDRFRYLQEAFADDPVEIMWDRRVEDRRQRPDGAAVERRHGERRHVPGEGHPPDWEFRRSLERRLRPEVRTTERRAADRRRPAPLTWTALDFLVVARRRVGDRPDA